MQNILITVITEYQFLIACNLIFEKFNDQSRFNIKILALTEPKWRRIEKQKIDLKELGVDFTMLEFDYFSKKPARGLKKKLNEIIGDGIDIFIFHFELDFISLYLANRLKRKGAKIIMAPDGIKAYISWIGNAGWKSRVLMTLRFYYYLIINGLFYSRLHTFNYRFAAVKEIDTIKVQYPEKYLNRTNKKVEQFDLLANNAIIEKVNRVFSWNPKVHNLETNGVIIYLSTHSIQYKEEEVSNFEFQAVKYLRDKYPGKKIYFKPHPVYIHDLLEKKVRNLAGVEIVKTNVPAELFIAGFTKSIVAGIYSTALLTHGGSNKFYWLRPMATQAGILQPWVILNNPTSHIKEVSSLDEIVF
jgi:hypothetical protein